MTWHLASRDSSLFTHVVMWLFAEGVDEADALKAYHFIQYGHPDWPSYSEWLVPR